MTAPKLTEAQRSALAVLAQPEFEGYRHWGHPSWIPNAYIELVELGLCTQSHDNERVTITDAGRAALKDAT